MSATEWKQHIEYPESDGLPMGETDLHIHWMIRINDILKRRYRGQKVYVASDLLVYYHEGFPSQFVVPDNFVVFDCDPGMRRVFKIWEEQRGPSVVLEVTSRSTSRNDYVTKMALYEELGVQEYFLYDPEEEYLDPPLQGQRLVGSRYEPIQAVDGQYRSQLLGVDLHRNDRDLVFVDILTGQECLTGEEFEREARLGVEAELQQLRNEIARMRGEQD